MTSDTQLRTHHSSHNWLIGSLQAGPGFFIRLLYFGHRHQNITSSDNRSVFVLSRSKKVGVGCFAPNKKKVFLSDRLCCVLPSIFFKNEFTASLQRDQKQPVEIGHFGPRIRHVQCGQ